MSEPVKHTPGPWSVRWPDYEQAELLREEAEDADEDDYPGAYRAALDAACAVLSAPNWVDFARVVVVVSGAADAAGEANARLIAAAPSMYEYIRLRAEKGDSDAAALIASIG